MTSYKDIIEEGLGSEKNLDEAKTMTANTVRASFLKELKGLLGTGIKLKPSGDKPEPFAGMYIFQFDAVTSTGTVIGTTDFTIGQSGLSAQLIEKTGLFKLPVMINPLKKWAKKLDKDPAFQTFVDGIEWK